MLLLFNQIRDDVKGAWKRVTHVVVAKLRILTVQPARGRVHRRWREIGREWMMLLLCFEITDNLRGRKEGYSHAGGVGLVGRLGGCKAEMLRLAVRKRRNWSGRVCCRMCRSSLVVPPWWA